jgi:hypothetical protein
VPVDEKVETPVEVEVVSEPRPKREFDPTYDGPLLMRCDELHGRRRNPSGSGRYNAGEILQAIDTFRTKKARKAE